MIETANSHATVTLFTPIAVCFNKQVLRNDNKQYIFTIRHKSFHFRYGMINWYEPELLITDVVLGANQMAQQILGIF